MLRRLTAGVAGILWVMPAVAVAEDSAKGARIFQQRCSICHSDVRNGPPNFGPNLFGVVGRAPGQVPVFDYSLALRTSSGLWTEARLKSYIADPGGTIPGARMSAVGPSDAEGREDLLAYLASLK